MVKTYYKMGYIRYGGSTWQFKIYYSAYDEPGALYADYTGGRKEKMGFKNCMTLIQMLWKD